MNMATGVLLGVAVLVVVYVISAYNRLVAVKHAVDKAWANIDVLLKQRHDELPKLVTVCKEYQQFEQSTLQQVIAARAQVQTSREQQDMAALGRAESNLRSGLGQIFAVAEAYPELRANESFQQLQSRISQLENALADRREFYNEAVNINNVRIELFPDRLIAQRFNFGPRALLTFAAEEKTDVDLKALFS
ncbi:MAG: hypothetical protein RL459_1553 [Pseudomonadota bacterium]